MHTLLQSPMPLSLQDQIAVMWSPLWLFRSWNECRMLWSIYLSGVAYRALDGHLFRVYFSTFKDRINNCGKRKDRLVSCNWKSEGFHLLPPHKMSPKQWVQIEKPPFKKIRIWQYNMWHRTWKREVALEGCTELFHQQSSPRDYSVIQSSPEYSTICTILPTYPVLGGARSTRCAAGKAGFIPVVSLHQSYLVREIFGCFAVHEQHKSAHRAEGPDICPWRCLANILLVFLAISIGLLSCSYFS